MIETFNNVIFWIGYFTIISVLLVLGLSAFWTFFEKLMQCKSFFGFIFNRAFEKSINNLDEKAFYKWHKELEEKYKKKNKC